MTSLTKVQMEMLDMVCRTNGGGVRIRCHIGEDGYGIPINTAYRKLQQLGLIQGKSGECETVVHTREGLSMWRSWKRPIDTPAP